MKNLMWVFVSLSISAAAFASPRLPKTVTCESEKMDVTLVIEFEKYDRSGPVFWGHLSVDGELVRSQQMRADGFGNYDAFRTLADATGFEVFNEGMNGKGEKYIYFRGHDQSGLKTLFPIQENELKCNRSIGDMRGYYN
jgi:hypothetical protein